jgi:16S rRNA A1518/A1519 N6-dimethyltransferase RsmA/KsgA/DIM1 with predicted DNA glycosylase/AP lyase activity
MARKRIELAQNFLIDHKLVQEIVTSSNISRKDAVIEIGPGEGIITNQLAKIAGTIVAVEVDYELFKKLSDRFRETKHVKIIHGDFMNFSAPDGEYKVFANIPFNLTSDIVRKLLDSPNPPITAHLIMQMEAAMKFAGIPSETEFSVFWKPW